MKKFLRVVLFLLCLIFAGVFVYSGYRLYDIWNTYHTSKTMYNSLSSEYVSTQSAQGHSGQSAPTEGEVEEIQAERSPIQVNFTQLKEQNNEVIGWIFSPDTVINYPVAQAKDNDYYLYNFIDGTYTGTGTPFLDCVCPGDFSGKNSIIYGHHMNDGSMFASLSNYRKEGYYAEHPALYLNTPSQNYKLEVIAGYVTDPDSEAYSFSFPDDESFLQYLSRARSQSDFQTDVEVTAEDRIVTLSTCTYEYYDARYVVLCKLVPIA